MRISHGPYEWVTSHVTWEFLMCQRVQKNSFVCLACVRQYQSLVHMCEAISESCAQVWGNIRVLSHVNESWSIWMSHVTCDFLVDGNAKPIRTCEWQYQWVMSHMDESWSMWMSHVGWYTWVKSWSICMNHVTYDRLVQGVPRAQLTNADLAPTPSHAVAIVSQAEAWVTWAHNAQGSVTGWKQSTKKKI